MVRNLVVLLLFSTISVAQILTVPNGGTGRNNLPNHGVVVGQDQNQVRVLTPGQKDWCFISGGPDVDPLWAPCPNKLELISPLVVHSPGATQTLTFIVPDTGNPTITSSTGTIDMSSLFVADLVGTDTSCLEVDAAGNVKRSDGACSPGMVVFQGTSDAVKDVTCSTSVGSPNLTCTDAPFATCPTGQTVSVTDGLVSTYIGAGSVTVNEGNSLITTIQSCSSATVAVMAQPAQNVTTNTTARWGTDNGSALFHLTNAATGGQTFVIPPGNYLIHTTSNCTLVQECFDHITGHSDTNYVFMKGVHIYWVGPRGCSKADPNCPGIDNGYMLFFLPDPLYGRPQGQHNIHIRIDGIIEGDNTDANGVGIPYLNQSKIVAWHDTSGDWNNWSNVTDITIDGSGTVMNLYGFSFWGMGGSRASVIGITHRHVAKGVNLNVNDSQTNFNVFVDSVGIENAARNVSIIGNVLNHSTPISIGGESREDGCKGNVVANNIFRDASDINLTIGHCVVGAVISGNTFSAPPPTATANVTAISIHDNSGAGDTTSVHDNLIVGNTFFAQPGCYGALNTYGIYVGGNTFSQNKMTGACYVGYNFSAFWQGHNAPDTIKGDTILGTAYDISVSSSSSSIHPSLQGPMLAGTGTIQNSSQLTVNSWWVDATGVKNLSGVHTINGNANAAQTIIGLGLARVDSSNGTTMVGLNSNSVGPLAAVSAGGQSVSVGRTVIGTNTTPVTPGTITLMPFTVPVGGIGTFHDCKVYIADATPSGKAYCALYAMDGTGGVPRTLLCGDTTGTVLAHGWTTVTSTQTCPTLTAGVTYAFAVMLDSAMTVTYSTGFPPASSYFTGVLNQFPAALASVTPNSNLTSYSADLISTVTVGTTNWNAWSADTSYSMLTTTGTVANINMVTPASDSNYYLTWQLQQVDTGSGGPCNAGTMGIVLGFTEALSNTPISAQISGRAFNAPGGTNGFAAGTTIDATNYFVGFPFEFTAKAGVAVTLQLTQLIASNCTTGQQFRLRAHLKSW